MDSCFNKLIPKPQASTIIFRPASKTYINGMCDSYQSSYDEEKLNGILTKKEFESIIDKMNDSLY